MLRYAVVSSLLFFCFKTYASKTLVLTDDLEEICICREYVDFFEDTSASMTIEKVSNLAQDNFTISTAQDLINENINSAYWLKFT